MGVACPRVGVGTTSKEGLLQPVTAKTSGDSRRLAAVITVRIDRLDAQD